MRIGKGQNPKSFYRNFLDYQIPNERKRSFRSACGRARPKLQNKEKTMVKQIVKDILIFRKAEEASKDDLQTARDLADTLRANSDICVGMAANMIGVNKRIIVFSMGPFVMTMINPVIVSKSKETYEAEEGCLSLLGTRKTIRHEEIEVEFCDSSFVKHRQKYSGFTAQIIQHEIDHCDGIVI
jgi:peptide deformylase